MDWVSDETDNSTNTVSIASTAEVIAGVNNQSLLHILPVTVSDAGQIDTVKIGGDLSTDEKTALGLPAGIEYHYQYLDPASMAFSVTTNTVIKVVDGANGDGIVGDYYRFAVAGNDSTAVVLESEDYSVTSRWTHLGSSLTSEQQAALSVNQSNETQLLAADLLNKFYVIKPKSLALPQLTYQNVGSMLIEQRATVVGWMTSHSGNAEALARYQVQLDEIDEAIEDLGTY